MGGGPRDDSWANESVLISVTPLSLRRSDQVAVVIAHEGTDSMHLCAPVDDAAQQQAAQRAPGDDEALPAVSLPLCDVCGKGVEVMG